MVHTFTAYLFLVTCIAAISTAKAQLKNLNEVIDNKGYTIHIYGTMESGRKAIHHMNVTILSETKFAELCSSSMCSLEQCVSDSKRACNMSNDCYKAHYKFNLTLKNDRYQTCEIDRINTVFTNENGTQLNGRCTGRGKSSCCCTLPETCICHNCRKSFRCDCTVETKKCTTTSSPVLNVTTIPTTTTSTTTTTRAATTRNTALDKTTSVAHSLTSTMTPSSGRASDTATSGTTIDNTATSTPSGTTLPGPASGKTKSDGQDPRQMEVLVGGVVGGLFGGVVITVVILFLCRACRSRRRHTEDEDGAETNESHTYLGLIHATSSSGKSPPGTIAVKSQVPDLIKVSAVEQASSAPSDVYDVIKEGDDNHFGVDPSACDQGDYVDITDDMTGTAVYSLAQAAPGIAVQGGTPQPAAEYFVLEKDDPTDGDYNKLVRDGATETGTDVQGTYNGLVREGATEATTDVQGTYNRLVREGATETTTDVQDTYNKLGSMADDNDDNEPAGNNGTAADYFVVEKPEDTYDKLEGKRSAEEEQEPYTKLGEATPKRESEPPDDPGRPSREYFILEDQT